MFFSQSFIAFFPLLFSFPCANQKRQIIKSYRGTFRYRKSIKLRPPVQLCVNFPSGMLETCENANISYLKHKSFFFNQKHFFQKGSMVALTNLRPSEVPILFSFYEILLHKPNFGLLKWFLRKNNSLIFILKQYWPKNVQTTVIEYRWHKST